MASLGRAAWRAWGGLCLLQLAVAKQVLIKEAVLDSAVTDIVYLGEKHTSVLLTTKNKRLYMSQDSGQNWAETTEQIESNAQIEVQRLTVNPTNKSVVVMQASRRARRSDGSTTSWYPYVYVSEDAGRTWRRAWGKNHGLHQWIPHATNYAWALVSWWSGGCSATTVTKAETGAEDADEAAKNEKLPCVHKLMVTTDLGRSFLEIAQYVVQFSWGTSESRQPDRVYFTSYRTKLGDQGKLNLWSQEVDFNYVDLSRRGKPKNSAPITAVRFGNKFIAAGEFLLVAKVASEVHQTVHLMVSKDGGESWKAAMLPSGLGELEEKWYTVLDTSEGAVILHLNSDAGGTKDTGRIFISDASGVYYSQSLVNNVRSGKGQCEFDKVVSLTGVYLANVVQSDSKSIGFAKDSAEAQERVEEEAAMGDAVEQRHSATARGGGGKAAKDERLIKSVISFDKGGAWNYLAPPRVNSLGQPYDCVGKPLEECSLHLHGGTSWEYYAPFYSSESSVGIIMGTGNVGSSLRFEASETSTFLSRDGGLTWMEAHKGAFIYEFGDHGGLIVMANDLKKTSEVVFTWNEGQSWFDFKVSETPFEVDNIITEPNLTATTFVMFGTRDDGVGVLYYMGFNALEFPTCAGTWAADSVSSDYETWTPSDGASKTESCILGQQMTYTRRKRSSQCFNGVEFERPVVKKKCPCTQADFSCAIGFSRTIGSTECIFGGVDMMPESLMPTICQGTFQAEAYRKVPGDQCEGGWAPTPVAVSCPAAATFGLKNLFFLLVVGGLAYLAKNHFAAGGKDVGFGARGTDFSLSSAIDACLLCFASVVTGITGFLASRNKGFDSHPTLGYHKVCKDDFDFDSMDGVGATTLNDFIAEADDDDQPPRVYDGAVAERREERTAYVSGGLSSASEPVPRLSAPRGGASGAANAFEMSADEDLL